MCRRRRARHGGTWSGDGRGPLPRVRGDTGRCFVLDVMAHPLPAGAWGPFQGCAHHVRRPGPARGACAPRAGCVPGPLPWPPQRRTVVERLGYQPPPRCDHMNTPWGIPEVRRGARWTQQPTPRFRPLEGARLRRASGASCGMGAQGTPRLRPQGAAQRCLQGALPNVPVVASPSPSWSVVAARPDRASSVRRP